MSKLTERLSRRHFLMGTGAAMLGGVAGCSQSMDMSAFQMNVDPMSTGGITPMRPQISIDKNITTPDVMYASVQEGPYALPAIPYQKVPKEFRRQIVPDPTGEAPGTIVVVTKDHFLYYVLPGGEALRYGVGIGKAGFEWQGRANVQYKKQWPRWTPPPEMIQRRPDLEKYRNGQEPGPQNPLGARALYIFQNGRDTGYRIHGSPEWWSIGQSMSSGCIRLMNQDIIDLYNRVQGKAPIIVS
ncbi:MULTISPECIES: L,D-transpeptidase [Ochrobactrum]|uniref:L,D-transpeptidase n=1 Tax=Ochrobactrum chromiisoli TaxID=2993941 RepID=A0ABT3QIQ1_9HYPH|nr:L,D-transpeptidase [Ochrobactrum chromiisoli]MCX2695469.1 L,D-transpeptidase [Ochrobactrum chromiisoli]